MEVMSDTFAAYDHANKNEQEIAQSSQCGCFSCYTTFPAADVKKWTDGTAWCPLCEAYRTVLGDKSGLLLTEEFLMAAHDHWIGPQQWLDALAVETQSIAASRSRKLPPDVRSAPKCLPWWKFW
ncbi:hypothetical protein [Pseudomonas sp. CAN1]|uniref:hypothetical protein n=1 Tax=Pseudomonas sp. CAN1 TaxID=3046726 RepID=UPI0026478DF4|nr:hypothetical protein [Pseudomonas sp. CAN1]